MRKLLITGGAGFIGANFVHYWARRHPADRMVVLDALTYAGNRESIADVDCEGGLRFVHGDIADAPLVQSLFAEEQFDTVVHFAAESHVDRSIEGPAAFVHTNVTGTLVLLEAAREAWCDQSQGRRFHHISTDEVYGSLAPDDPAFTEQTPYDPSSPYSASKAASDHLVRAWHRTYGLPVSISNCSNNYGPLQHREKLIPTVIHNALANRPIPVYGKGGNIRDWLHVEDHCSAIECILETGDCGRTWNVGGRCEMDNLTLVYRLCALVDELAGGGPRANLVRFVGDRPGHDFRYAINCDRIASELGWQPATDIEDGLRRTVRWYMERCDDAGPDAGSRGVMG